ncbi:MAG TPA: hypothetical protein VIX73_20385 [Kofleriaceae bacterium]|jgi:DNA-directed RNA polymerase specialized sigma24 family protein
MEDTPSDSGEVRRERASLVRQLVHDYRTQLLVLAARLVGCDDAAAVAQEAFVRLAQRIARRPLPEVLALLRSPPDLRKLMYRITVCRAFEHLRRRSGHSLAAPLPGDDVERLEAAYASLSPMQRIAHVLHYYYGFTSADFKLTLGISKANSRTLVCRANRALKRAMETMR